MNEAVAFFWRWRVLSGGQDVGSGGMRNPTLPPSKLWVDIKTCQDFVKRGPKCRIVDKLGFRHSGDNMQYGMDVRT